MKKKILIVCYYFYPILTPRSFRATELCKEFCRQGHDVTLLTHFDPSHHEALMEEFGFKVIDLGKRPEQLGFDSSTSKFHPQRIIRKILITFFEYPTIFLMPMVKKQLKKLSGFDLMVSIATPHPIHWGVALARNAKHRIAKKWIADCGDPFMLVPYAKGLDKKMFYFKFYEKAFCRKADYITIPNISMRKNFYPEFAHKIREIPQGFKFEETTKHLRLYHKNPVPTFVFAGNFYPNIRDPKEFIEILLSQDKDFRFHIYTKKTTLIRSYLEEAKGRIIVHDYVSREELIGILSQMDFLVNIGYDASTQLPSKLIDYYLTDRPILNLPSKNINKDIVFEFLEGNYRHQFRHPNIDEYRIENVSKKFLELN